MDDIYGASFVDGAVSGDPMDLNGHGTFVAGVVGAVGNNNLGVTGMNQAISLIACRFMDATGNGWVSDAIQCIDYCISKDAHVMSNSWGGVDYSAALQVSNHWTCSLSAYITLEDLFLEKNKSHTQRAYAVDVSEFGACLLTLCHQSFAYQS